MADDADRAQLEIESELAHARLAAQVRSRLMPTGHCQNCDERLDRAGTYFAIESVPKTSKSANAN